MSAPLHKKRYAVIFRAELAEPDKEYERAAQRLRQLAQQRYGCIEFISFTDGNHELSISYWENPAHIQAWKANAEHQLAQALGRTQWYTSYRIEVVEVVREHHYGP